MTIEDPVEVELPGIVQTQVHDHVGFGFAKGLRSLLRNDPDVILVGEIRDQICCNCCACSYDWALGDFHRPC